MNSITTKDPVLLSKVCRESFSISEIIFNMIHSDNFRVKLENLEIIISDENRIRFDADSLTSLDNLTFDKPMYAKFEKLLSDGWITIKSVKICCDSEFTFLLKYSNENIEYNRFNSSNPDKITEYKLFLNRYLPYQVCELTRKINKSKKITLTFTAIVNPGDDTSGTAIIIEQLKEAYLKFDNFKLNICLGFSIDVDHSSLKSIDENEQTYDIIMNCKERRPRANIDVVQITLTVNLGMASSSKVKSYLDYTSSTLNTKLVKSMIIRDEMPNFFEVDLTAIKRFENLESILFYSRVCFNYKTLGDLRDLKKLKKLVFSSAKVDYDWMSNYLPSSIETLNLIQSNFSSSSILKVPSNLKNFELHANGTNRFNFHKINFENAKGLEKIVLSLMYKQRDGSKAGEIVIEGMKKLPESVKYLLVEGDNLEQQFLPLEKLKITGVDVSGVYSNVGSKNKYLSLTIL